MDERVHNKKCNHIQCMVAKCYYNELGWCTYVDFALKTRTYITAVVMNQDGTCAMMRTPDEGGDKK